MGVAYDNLEDYPMAIEQYKNLAGICKKTQNAHLEGLAYNCIGVDLQVR